MPSSPVRIWRVGTVSQWGRARGRFIEATDGRRGLQFWVWGNLSGDLLASLCQAAHDHERVIRVTWKESKHGLQLTQAEWPVGQVSA